MKVLLLSPWYPSPAFGGALIRVFETLRHLSRSHRVTLLAPVDRAPAAKHIRAIADLGVEVVTVPVSENVPASVSRIGRGFLRGQSLLQGLHFDAGLARELRRLSSERAYDIIQIEHSFMAPYMRWVGPDSPAKTVLSMHNIESLRFRRETHVSAWSLRRAALGVDDALFGTWEERAVRTFDGIAAVSPIEQAWAEKHAPTCQVALVPNGVSLSNFQPAARPAAPRTIVFSGLMNYPPNADAVIWFCDAILPLVARRYPDVRFAIVGDKPIAAVQALARRPGVEVTGRVEDVRPYLAHAAAAVVPVRAGAGTRLKILEAMAMQRPVVATALGAEGLTITPGLNILIGDSPAAFADHVCALLESPRFGDRLGREGRQLVEKTYDWRLCFRSLDDLYEKLTGIPHFHESVARTAVVR